MKLKVYQQGGGLIYTPFIPGRTSSKMSGSDSGSGENEPKLDPLDKEILALMKDQNLLPSDIQAIFNSLSAFQRRTQHLTAAGAGTSAYRSVMPGMLQIMNMVSVARANKQQWDNSVTEVKKHDAGSEVALDGYGRMWVMDTEDGKLLRVSPKDYDSSKHAPISNSQLLSFRQRNDDLAFSDKMFGETGMDVVGMKDIREELDSMISKLGKIKSENPRVQKLSDIASGIEGLGIFQISQEYSKGDLADFSQLLYSRLSNEAKHLIDANAAIGGYDKFQYILNIIRSETSQEESVKFDASLSKAAGFGAGAGDGSEKLNDHDTYPERLATGQTEIGAYDFILTKANGNKLWTFTQNYGPAMSNGNGMETMSMEQFYRKFDASGIVDWSKATFGDYQISAVDLPKIMYKGGSTVKRVVLPVKQDGSINFKAQEEADVLQNWINEHEEVTDALIQERVQEIDNAYWDPEHRVIKFKNAKAFLAVDTISSSDKVRFNPDSDWVYKMDRDPNNIRKDWLDLYESVLENGFIEHQKEKKYDFGSTAGRHLYEAVMFLPIISDTIGAAVYHDQNVPKSRYYNVRGQAIDHQNAINLKGSYNG